MAWCINKVTDTLGVCSTHCFSTAAMVTRTLLHVTCLLKLTFMFRAANVWDAYILACTFISRIYWFIYHNLCKNALVFEIIKHGIKDKPKIRIWFWHFFADIDQGTVFVLSSSVSTPPRSVGFMYCTRQEFTYGRFLSRI